MRNYSFLLISLVSGFGLGADLHQYECYKYGSQLLEKAEFLTHAQKVLLAQKKLQMQSRSAAPARVFHRKSHGCLTGKLRVRNDRDVRLREGIFSVHAKTEYDVVARFSNGVGIDQHDLRPDVRGLAIKILGTDDSAFPDRHSMDILSTNAPNPFGRDQQEFIEFMEATVNPGFLYKNMAVFAAKHPQVMKSVLKRTLRVTKSLTEETFWSGHAYLMGPNRAVKFNLSSVGEEAQANGFGDRLLERSLQAFERTLGRIADLREWFKRQTDPITSKIDPNYLRKDLYRRANIGEIRYLFSAQIEVDEDKTPIENTFQEWLESDAPSLPLADLVFDVQDPSPLYSACEKLSFTPGKFHSQHRPLGNMGRGRIFAYDASQRGRSAIKDPTNVDELLDLSEKN